MPKKSSLYLPNWYTFLAFDTETFTIVHPHSGLRKHHLLFIRNKIFHLPKSFFLNDLTLYLKWCVHLQNIGQSVFFLHQSPWLTSFIEWLLTVNEDINLLWPLNLHFQTSRNGWATAVSTSTDRNARRWLATNTDDLVITSADRKWLGRTEGRKAARGPLRQQMASLSAISVSFGGRGGGQDTDSDLWLHISRVACPLLWFLITCGFYTAASLSHLQIPWPLKCPVPTWLNEEWVFHHLFLALVGSQTCC